MIWWCLLSCPCLGFCFHGTLFHLIPSPWLWLSGIYWWLPRSDLKHRPLPWTPDLCSQSPFQHHQLNVQLLSALICLKHIFYLIPPHTSILFPTLVTSHSILPIAWAKNFGVLLILRFLPYFTSNLSNFRYLYLQNTLRIRFSPPFSATTIVHATLISHPDFYNMSHS